VNRVHRNDAHKTEPSVIRRERKSFSCARDTATRILHWLAAEISRILHTEPLDTVEAWRTGMFRSANVRGVWITRAVFIAALSIAGYACDSTTSDTSAVLAPESTQGNNAASDATGVQLPALWSAEGLAVQPRLDELGQRIPPDMGWQPATTSWQQARRDVPDALRNDGAGSPGVLLYRLAETWDWAASLGLEVWEHTLRVHQTDDDHATGVMLAWGFMDDSLAGGDLRVQMSRDNATWRIVAIEERHHCVRGVTGDGLLCL
jgi:hypothetical protein